MRARAALVAPVVGALAIAGATTGTTLALWRDSSSAGASSLGSGSISLTLNNQTTAVNLGSVTNLLQGNTGVPGPALTVTATVKHEAPVAAKNLRMHVHLDSVITSSGSATLNSSLEVAATTVATAAPCPSPVGTYKPLSAYTSTQVTGTPIAPQASMKLCVGVRMKANPPAGSQGRSGTLTFTFRGQQA